MCFVLFLYPYVHTDSSVAKKRFDWKNMLLTVEEITRI